MKAEIKDIWIAALLSGDYARGTGALRRSDDTSPDDEYCCLGVLCDLAVRAGMPVEVMGPFYGRHRFDGEASLPPRSVMDWAGLRTVNGGFSADEGDDTLVRCNDEGATFEQIAAIISEKWSEL